MYLITAYFDNKTAKKLNELIKGIACKTNNKFMIENNISPHMTLTGFDSQDSIENIKNRFWDCTDHCNISKIVIPNIGFYSNKMIFAGVVSNSEILRMHNCINHEVISLMNGSIRKYYYNEAWMPHITLAKTLNASQFTKGIEYVVNDFSYFEGNITEIGLSKKNPKEEIIRIMLNNDNIIS